MKDKTTGAVDNTTGIDEIFNEFEESVVNKLTETEGTSQSYENLEPLEQGSKAWFKARLGKFTGSKIPDLMKKGRSKDDYFGETAKKVIRMVYLERNLSVEGIDLYIDELFNKEFRQTKWGNYYEEHARSAYSILNEVEVEVTTFQVSKIKPNIGGSFDGRVINQPKIVEIKCPYDLLIHDNNVQMSLCNGVESNHDYYGQIQCNIFVGEAESCDFVSYDPRVIRNFIVTMNVKRDEEYIAEMLKRIDIAERAINYLEYIDIDGALLLAIKEYNEQREAE